MAKVSDLHRSRCDENKETYHCSLPWNWDAQSCQGVVHVLQRRRFRISMSTVINYPLWTITYHDDMDKEVEGLLKDKKV